MALAGCASSRAANGAAIGAASGAALGAGVGVLITDEDLLGSSASEASGDTSLPSDGGIAASIAIGAVVGAVVGAMTGHQQEHGYPDPDPVVVPPPSDPAVSALDEEARAPAPRAF